MTTWLRCKVPDCRKETRTGGRLKSWRCHKHDTGPRKYATERVLWRVRSVKKHQLWRKADGKRHGRVSA